MKNEKMLVDFWRVQVESAIYSLAQVAGTLPPSTSGKAISQKGAAALRGLRSIIPYCLHPAGGDGSMILVNRVYLPLGNTIPGFVSHALYKWAHVPPEHPISKLGRTYFFGDGSAPGRSKGALESLIERLRKLLTMEDESINPVNLSSHYPTDDEVQP